ncbi:MAG: hypothetical protein JO161_05985 [Planctomycetaceae bacterium]|nr:hypothetical protein [Planctomycetaceae bacterium]
MPVPIHPGASRANGTGSLSPFHDPKNITELFLGVFRRDVLSFYPGSRIDRKPGLALAGSASHALRPDPSFALDFQLDDKSPDEARTVRVSLFGTWYRLSVASGLGFGPRDRELLSAMGRVMDLHHQVLFRGSRMTLLQLRRGMPEDHYVAASVEPSAYSPAASATSRTAEAILTLRTLALSTYENRRVATGVLILGSNPRTSASSRTSRPQTPPEALPFGVELTGLKTLHRLCDGRRTLFLVDQEGKLAELVDVRQWAISQVLALAEEKSATVPGSSESDQEPPSDRCDETELLLSVPCARTYMFHALASRTGGHVCLVLSPNQEIKVFAAGVQAFVFAHGRWRVLDPESRFTLWERAVANRRLARVLFQTALDLVEERQGGLLVVVADPARAIGRLLSPHDVLEIENASPGGPQESPARPLALFGLDIPSEDAQAAEEPACPKGLPDSSPAQPLTKRSMHYLARGASVLELDAAVIEALAGLDGALVTDAEGRLLAFGAILRHDVNSLNGSDPQSPPAIAEGARTTAALAASRFGPVLKISEDGIVSFFLDGKRVWDL